MRSGLSVQPIVLGVGKPLFKDVKERHALTLLEARPLRAGAVWLELSRASAGTVMNAGTLMRGLCVCLGLVFQLACGAPLEQSSNRYRWLMLPSRNSVTRSPPGRRNVTNAAALRSRRRRSRGDPAPRVSPGLVRVSPDHAALGRTFTVVAVDLRGIGDLPAAATMRQRLRRTSTNSPAISGWSGPTSPATTTAAWSRMRLPAPPAGHAWRNDPRRPDPRSRAVGASEGRSGAVAFRVSPNANAPEHLIAGREAIYFREVFFNRLARNPGAISDDDLAHYVCSYASPDQLRAGLEFYRAYTKNERLNAAQREPMDVPIVLAGGDQSLAPLNATIAKACVITAASTSPSKSSRTVDTR